MPNKALLDLTLKRQVLLERLKSGEVRKFNEAFAEIEKLVRYAFSELDGDLYSESRRTLGRFVAALEKDMSKELTKSTKLFMADLSETAGIYAAAEATDLIATVEGVKSTLKTITQKQAWSSALKTPMGHSGESLTGFIDNFAGREKIRIANTIRKGYTEGRTNQEIVRGIIGTKRNNYKDGILQMSRRNAESMVRTSVQHTASVARQATWEANSDIVDRYRWVSTLDSRTTTQCKSLDGREFPLGRGPTPPIHVNCRSATIAVLSEKYQFLSKGRTRSAEFGPVSADKNYYDWLKGQNVEFQNLALGKDRAQLFRKGGLSADEFSKLQLDKNFQPLTLDEMRAINPEAFKDAGLNPGD